MFQELNISIDKDRLSKCVEELQIIDLLNKNNNQIAVHHRGAKDKNQLTDGTQSLVFDWDSYDPNIHDSVPRRPEIIKESSFNIVCDLFKNTYIEDIINDLNKLQKNVFRGRFMMLRYKTCLSTHHDDTPRIHVPIITNPDSFMVINDQILRMEVGKVYDVDTRHKHTAVNSGKKDRVHLIFCHYYLL